MPTKQKINPGENGEEVILEPAAEPEQGNGIYEMGMWGAFPQWKCLHCPWDTLDGEAAMLEHYARVHLVRAAEPARTIPVFDRWGNEVK
jgi:hypothetical protein